MFVNRFIYVTGSFEYLLESYTQTLSAMFEQWKTGEKLYKKSTNILKEKLQKFY